MSEPFKQTAFNFMEDFSPDIPVSLQREGPIRSSDNSINTEDKMIHDWYRFVLSFPPHLVRDYLRDFDLQPGGVVLDPFCGTGTTLVECQLNGGRGIGIEANPFPEFASRVKTDWSVNPDNLATVAMEVAERSLEKLASEGFDDLGHNFNTNVPLRRLPPQAERALITNSISPIPLHKVLVLLEEINRFSDFHEHQYMVLALGKALVASIGNLRFGPEVGIGKVKSDAPVVGSWRAEIRRITADLQQLQGRDYLHTTVYLADARELSRSLSPESVQMVITSPPYPNEKDYTRTTRLESVILGFYQDMPQLRLLKKSLLRSNTRGVYITDSDDQFVQSHARIQAIATEIEERRLALGKTSGFEKLYSRVTKLYFGGMARHFMELTRILRPGAHLAYVVGDQASYLQVMIRTGELLAEIAEDIGYEVKRLDLFRTRFATATQTDLREEVLVLKWNGRK